VVQFLVCDASMSDCCLVLFLIIDFLLIVTFKVNFNELHCYYGLMMLLLTASVRCSVLHGL